MSEIREASERLASSRQRLRQVMRESIAAPGQETNPLRIAGSLAADAVQSAVQPMARRHPLGLVLGAAVAGGMVAWSRPWRWALTPALIATVLPQLVIKGIGSTQPGSWMRQLAALTRHHNAPNRAVRRQHPPI